MNTLSVIIPIIVGIIGIISGTMIPITKFLNKKHQEQQKRNAMINKVPKIQGELNSQILALKASVDGIINRLNEQVNTNIAFQITMLKFTINSIYYGYSSVEDIPLPLLITAIDAYLRYREQGLNHEITPIGQELLAEQQRRLSLERGDE